MVMTKLNPAAINGGGSPKRNRTGLYSTPPDCIDALLMRLHFQSKSIMEPCAGNGALTKRLQEGGYHVGYECDIDPQREGIDRQDFLSLEGNKGCDAIITNPPFSLFEKFVRKVFSLGINTQAYLLKVNTFSAMRRRNLFIEHRPHFKLDLQCRPDFLGGGSPTMDFCWIVWMGSPCASFCQYDLLPRP